MHLFCPTCYVCFLGEHCVLHGLAPLSDSSIVYREAWKPCTCFLPQTKMESCHLSSSPTVIISSAVFAPDSLHPFQNPCTGSISFLTPPGKIPPFVLAHPQGTHINLSPSFPGSPPKYSLQVCVLMENTSRGAPQAVDIRASAASPLNILAAYNISSK